MSDLNSMADIIRNEIKTFEQKLQEHTFHVNQLRDLLGKIAPERTMVSVEAVPKFRSAQFIEKLEGIGRNVAAVIRQKKISKREAVEFLVDQGMISGNPKTLRNQLCPSVMGKELFNEVFKGTRYTEEDWFRGKK